MRIRIWLLSVWGILFPLSASENLLLNPGFEEEGESISAARAWTFYLPDGGVGGRTTLFSAAEGASAYLVKKRGAISASVSQTVAVKPETPYRLAAKLKGKGKLFAYELAADKTYIRNTDGVFAYGEKFTEKEIQIVTGKNTRFCRIIFEIYGKQETGEGAIDDVLFQEKPGFPVKKGALAVTLKNGEVSFQWPELAKGYSYAVSRSVFPEQSSAGERRFVRENHFEEDLPEKWSSFTYFVELVHPSGTVSPWYWSATLLNPKAPPAQMHLAVSDIMRRSRRYAETEFSDRPLKLNYFMAGNEYESRLLSVTALNRKIERLKLELIPFREPGLRGRLLRLEYLPVEQPRIAGVKGGLLADPVLPFSHPACIPVNATQGFLVQIYSTADCPPGIYRSELKIFAEGIRSVSIPLTVSVAPFSLPVKPSFQSAFAIWKRDLAEEYKLEPDSPAFYKLWKTYYDFLLDYRLCGGMLPVRNFCSDETLELLKDERITAFQLPLAYQNVDRKRAGAVGDFCRRHNLSHRAYVYLDDEPEPGRYAKCVRLLEEMRAAAPNVRKLIVFNRNPVQRFAGKLDIWCAHLNLADNPFWKERREAGDAFWWYTCGVFSSLPNYTIDEAPVRIRLLAWCQFLYGVKGILYWQVNGWNNRNINSGYPFAESRAGVPYYGDGFLLYPGERFGCRGPISSLRLEVIRDGNEDFEYLVLLYRLLKKKNPESAFIEIMARILPLARSLTDRTDSPELLERQRKRIAEEIIRLSQELHSRNPMLPES